MCSSDLVLCGSAPGVYAALCTGATGAILAVACVRAALCLELLGHVQARRYKEALACQQRLTPLARAVTTGFGIAGLKKAMDLCGMVGGEPRAPLAPLTADAADTLRTLLDATS